MSRRFALPLILAILATISPLHAKDPSLAVITEDLSGEIGDGAIEMVESLAESGISRAPGVSLISRRHLEKLLAEQGLAYNNIVNDRARLGRLAPQGRSHPLEQPRQNPQRSLADSGPRRLTAQPIKQSSHLRLTAACLWFF